MNSTKISSRQSESFFFYYAWFILSFVFLSFGAKAIFDPQGLPPLTYLHHLHALAMLSWFFLFALQPTLIRFGKVNLHRTIGKLSPIVVLLFIGFAIPISLLNWDRTGRALIITANSVNLIAFISLYVFAILKRQKAATHKRLMLYATISLLGPAAGRVPEIFDQSPFMAVPLIFALQLAPLVHDKIVHRKIHRATWVGFFILIATIPIIVGLSESSAWKEILVSLLGSPRDLQ
jgi:hypothetical protein